MKKVIVASALASAALMAAPSHAATVVTSCASLGIDDIVPNAEQCVGYYNKNVLKSSAGDSASPDEATALNILGLTGPIKVLEKLDNSGNFVTPLNGLTFLGVHYGAGSGPVSTPGGVTAFYRFNAGTNLDSIGFTNGSVSGVSLYSTGPAVPEPATWALMLAGFGFIGAATRRRQRTAVTFA